MADRKDHIDLFGGGFLVVFSLLLGLNQVLVKIVNQGFEPTFQAGLRSSLAFFCVLGFALFARKRLSMSDGSFWPGMLAGVFFAGEFLLLFQAVEYTTVARASVMFYTMPFWAAIGAHLFIAGEKLTSIKLVGLMLAMIGVAWALLDNAAPASDYALLGDLACILGAMCWAGILIVARTTNLSRAVPEMQLLYQLAFSGIVLIALSLIFTDPIRAITPGLLGIFAFQVTVIVSCGFLGWLWIVSIYPAAQLASFSFLAPVFGVMFSWLILDEVISLSIIGGLVLVSLGIILINKRPKSAAA